MALISPPAPSRLSLAWARTREALTAGLWRSLPALLAIGILVTPIAVAAWVGLFHGGGEAWASLKASRVFGQALATLALMGLSAALMLVTALPAAWLVTMHRFPGRRLFEWLLILPLAAPGYVLAFAYMDLFGVAGPLQSMLRDVTGWAARDYWFPDIASLPGAAFVLSAALYPYVYLGARAAFISQSMTSLEAARTLGAPARRLFLGIALPGARRAIMAALALALMEIAADYGVTSFLGVQTLTVSLFASWKAYGDAGVAARIALILMAIVLALQALEGANKAQTAATARAGGWRRIEPTPLSRAGGWAAFAFCLALLAWGFLVPMARLIWIAAETATPVAPVMDGLRNSVLLAGIGTILAFVLAVIIAFAQRGGPPLNKAASIAVSSGYAMPGAVLALGAIIVTGAMTRAGWIPGLSMPVAIAALAWVYASRFTAAGASAIAAGLARAPDSIRHAARSLGAGPVRRTLTIELPLAASGAFAGLLILFVEILKELPATLMLRPFDWDTLAVRAYTYASDERLAAAALPSLLITLAGLVPVVILSRQLSRARPGATL